MRSLESVLKIAFLVLGIALIWTKNFTAPGLQTFLGISFVLGVVLIFNHHTSYNFKQKPSDLAMRRIEGILLVVFAIVIFMFSM